MSRDNQPDPAEVSRHLDNLSRGHLYNFTTDKATAKKLLENEWIFCQGDIRDIRAKHLGLGVYKVYTEQRPL